MDWFLWIPTQGQQNPAQACPVCGAVQPDYEQVNLSQPRGFRTWFGASRDFDGVFEWTARASRPKIGVAPIAMTPVHNFEVWSGQETVHVINDNDGRLFDFEKLAQGETWVTRDSLSKIGVMNPPLAPYFAASPGWQLTSIAGLQADRRGNVVEIITHPLWNTDPNYFGPQLAAATPTARSRSITSGAPSTAAWRCAARQRGGEDREQHRLCLGGR